jgi:hypothetical protein
MPRRYRRATSKSSTETSTLLNRVLDRAFSSANPSRQRASDWNRHPNNSDINVMYMVKRNVFVVHYRNGSPHRSTAWIG